MKKVIGFLVMSLFLVSCSNSSTKDEKVNLKLEGVTWSLEKYNSQDKLLNPLDGVEVNMVFKDGKVTGTSGVNSYFSGYQVLNNQNLKFGKIGSTMKAGTEEAMKQEKDFLRSLESVNSYVISGHTLTLKSNSQTILIFDGEMIKEKKDKKGGVSFGIGVGIGL